MALPTELCLAKAAYLAHHSTEAAASIRVGMIFLLTLLNTPLVLGAIIGIVSAESRPPSREHIKLPERLRGLPPRRKRALCAACSIPLIACTVLSTATYIYAVQHQFYCEGELKRHHWISEWVFAGLVVGSLVLVAAGNWVHIMLLYVLGRSQDVPSWLRGWNAPLGLYLLVAPVAITITAVLVLAVVLCALLYATCTCNPGFLIYALPSEIKTELMGEGGNVDMGALTVLGGVKGANDGFDSEQSSFMKPPRRQTTTRFDFFQE